MKGNEKNVKKLCTEQEKERWRKQQLFSMFYKAKTSQEKKNTKKKQNKLKPLLMVVQNDSIKITKILRKVLVY